MKSIFDKIKKSISKKQIIIVTLITIISMAISAAVSIYVLNPIYKSSTTMIINRNSMDHPITYEDITVSEKLTLTYEEIIKSRAVLEKVSKKLGLDIPYKDLLKLIDVESIKGTQIIEITVKNTNKELAKDIANLIPSMFIDEGNEVVSINNVKIIDEAILAEEASSPKIQINIIAAGIVGLILSTCMVLLPEYMKSDSVVDKNYEDEDNI